LLLSILNDPVRASTEQHLARLRSIELSAPPSESFETIQAEVGAIRSALGRIRFVISAYPEVMSPIRGGPLTYTLDSSDPEKLKAIVDNMQHRAHEPIAQLLPHTLVIGKNYATERLRSIYRKFSIENEANFADIDASRAILYQLALASQKKNDALKHWLECPPQPEAAPLAAFLQAQIESGRDKITLLLPQTWSAAGEWTARAFNGLNLIAGEKPNLRNLGQDRVFIIVQRKGEEHPEAAAIKALRNAQYPAAVLTFNATAPLSRYLQLIEATVTLLNPAADQLAAARESLAAKILADGIANNAAWKQLHASPESPKSLANAISYGARSKSFACGEIALFGDLRYSENAALLRKTLDNAARLLFRQPFKMPATICEAPSGMLFGRGDRFSLLICPAVQNRFALAQYEPDRSIAEFLATKQILENHRRQVRAILVKDLSPESIAILAEFLSETAGSIPSGVTSPRKYGQIQSR
jgi:hypothetical protein